MTYMLNSIDEAIDRKFLVTKSLTNQVEAGTIVHIMGAEDNANGLTVYYRITYTNQDYSVKFASLKEFCKWARPDNFIARHYESFNIKEIQKYIKIKDRTFTTFCLPIIGVLAVILWAIMLIAVPAPGKFIGGAIGTIVIGVAVFFIHKSAKHRAMIKLYSKVSANSNWGVNFK